MEVGRAAITHHIPHPHPPSGASSTESIGRQGVWWSDMDVGCGGPRGMWGNSSPQSELSGTSIYRGFNTPVVLTLFIIKVAQCNGFAVLSFISTEIRYMNMYGIMYFAFLNVITRSILNG